MNQLDQDLGEESTICSKDDGFGITIQIYSNNQDPAHAYVFNGSNGKEGVFELKHRPFKPEEIVPYNPEINGFISPDIRKKIVHWAESLKDGVNNWERALSVWKILHIKD